MTETQPTDSPEEQPATGAASSAAEPGLDLAAISVASFTDVLADLGATDALAAATEQLRLRRAGEVRELLLAAHWATLHGQPLPCDGPDQPHRDPMITPGGEGTPELREYCLPELAMARHTHTLTVRALVADALDLHHRLPATWAKVLTLACEPWLARKVAVLTRHLPADRVALVDRAVAAAITGHAPSTVLEITAAKVIEADPEAHAERRETERHRRYATLSRCDEYGYRTIIARITAGDATWLDALIDRTADILAIDHGHDHNRDELRSLAVGWLARPAELLKLLLDHTEQGAAEPAADPHDPHDPEEPEEPEPAPASRPAWAPDHLATTVDRLASMSTRQLAALRGRGTIFVHLTDTSAYRQAGIARTEGLGPHLVQAISELLGHADVSVKPVLDLRDRRRVDAYEHPDAHKDHAWAQAGGDVFPYSPRTATRDSVDFDHPLPYDPTGPPGQTGPHNSGPLRRRHHRWKTFGGYRCRQAGPGRHLWQTPHGLCLLVDHRGTHRLAPAQAELILATPPGTEIYFSDPVDVGAYDPCG